MKRRGFVAGAVASLLTAKSVKADGIQAVSNNGQIVSTGDVWVTQAAGGQQNVYDGSGRLIASQAVGNDLQIVSTGSVHSAQSAAGSQNVYGSGGGGGGGSCTPGTYQQNGNCVQWCSDQCQVLSFCCDNKDKKGKCCH